MGRAASIGVRTVTVTIYLRLRAPGLQRKNEPRYAELDLGGCNLDDDGLIVLMVADPVLVERPDRSERRQDSDRPTA